MNLHVLPSNRGISRTDIEWADYAVGSPFRFRDKGTGQVYPTACVKVSDGCKNCYAESIGKRFGTYLPFTKPNMDRLECFLDQGVIDHVLSFKPRPPKGEATFKNGRSRPAVFFGDTTDIFGEWVTFEQLDALFACFALRPDVDFLLLTKRPERMAEYLDRPWVTMADGRTGLRDGINAAAFDLTVGRHVFPTQAHGMIDGPSWPLPNVWLGCSVENQTTADVRIPHLLKCPAAVRFLSVEPLLGAVDLKLRKAWSDGNVPYGHAVGRGAGDLHWIIVGGESGHDARPSDVERGRSVVRQCADAGVLCFMKQLGAWPLCGCGGDLAAYAKNHGFKRVSCASCNAVYPLRNRKGSDPSEWPADLRVRQVPGGAA